MTSRLTLREARQRLLQAQLGRGGARRDGSSVVDQPTPSTLAASMPRTQLSVQVAVGAHTAQGMQAAYHDKRTGEWKVRATAPRRTGFGAQTLYDHNLGRLGEQLGRRKQESYLFITINTNKRRFNETVDTAAMNYAIERCFREDAHAILRFGPKHPGVYGDDAKWPGDVIESMSAQAGVERGPRTGALHAHIWFKIVHWSQLQVDRAALQALFKESYNHMAETKIPPRGLPAVHIELLEQTDYGTIMAHYLSKQMDVLPAP